MDEIGMIRLDGGGIKARREGLMINLKVDEGSGSGSVVK
jgi:hypothetical protein